MKSIRESKETAFFFSTICGLKIGMELCIDASFYGKVTFFVYSSYSVFDKVSNFNCYGDHHYKKKTPTGYVLLKK